MELFEIVAHPLLAERAQRDRDLGPGAVRISLFDQGVGNQQAGDRHGRGGRGAKRAAGRFDIRAVVAAGEQEQQQLPALFTEELAVEETAAQLAALDDLEGETAKGHPRLRGGGIHDFGLSGNGFCGFRPAFAGCINGGCRAAG